LAGADRLFRSFTSPGGGTAWVHGSGLTRFFPLGDEGPANDFGEWQGNTYLAKDLAIRGARDLLERVRP
jgi:hypothetical protein